MKARSPLTSIFIMFALLVAAGVGAVKLFGTTVSQKFSNAQGSVMSEVSFGGGSGGGRSYFPAARREAPAPARNVAAVPTETHEDYGVNPTTRTAEDNLSTFAIDVDTGSYTHARKQILSFGYLPAPASVRVEEFVNYFGYDYPTPTEGAFTVAMEGAPSPFSTDPSRKLLRIGIQGERPEVLPPFHLTFLVDVSGSMGDQDKLPYAQMAMRKMVDRLRARDTISIVTYAGRVNVLTKPTRNKATLNAAIDSLVTGGGTAMGSGMELAYEQASKAFVAGHSNRVIVLSDGDANIGRTSHTEIHETIRHHADEDITLSTIGLGAGNYNEVMMEQLADHGNGNYVYVDNVLELERMFTDGLDSMLHVIAKDMKVQVEFNTDAVSEYRLIGYENRDVADADFRNDRVDGGEVGAGHSVTALYEAKVTDPNAQWLAQVRVRAKTPQGRQAEELRFVFTGHDVHKRLAFASPDFQFATAVAGFAEILRGSPYSKTLNYDLIAELAAPGVGPEQPKRREFLRLVEAAKDPQGAAELNRSDIAF